MVQSYKAMINRIQIFLVLAIILAGVRVCAQGLTPSPGFPTPSATYSGWGWTTAKWTGDDRPFAAARRTIDAQSTSGQDMGREVDVYQKLAAANPKSAIGQYQSAYASFVWLKEMNKDPSRLDDWKVTFDLLAVDQPPTYNYLRAVAIIVPPHPQMQPLYEKLLQRNPHDAPVELSYANMLTISRSKADIYKGLSIAQSVARSGADSPSCYMALVYAYGGAGLASSGGERSTDFKKANEAIDQFQKLARPDDYRQEIVFKWRAIMKRLVDSGNP